MFIPPVVGFNYIDNKINKNLEEQALLIFSNYINNNNCSQKRLLDIANIKYGKGISSKSLLKQGYPVFGGNGIIGCLDSYMYKTPQILISCRGAASGKIIISLPYSNVSSNSLVIELKDYNYFEFYKQYFKSNELYQYATGSAQPQITIENITDIQIPVPNYNFDSINGILSGITKLQLNIYYLNINLIKIRDMILPKLMSSEIDVSKTDI